MFRQTSAGFDEAGGVKSLLMNHLRFDQFASLPSYRASVFNGCELIFDSGDMVSATTAPSHQESVVEMDMNGSAFFAAECDPISDQLLGIDNLELCPTFESFKFGEWEVDSDLKLDATVIAPDDLVRALDLFDQQFCSLKTPKTTPGNFVWNLRTKEMLKTDLGLAWRSLHIIPFLSNVV